MCAQGVYKYIFSISQPLVKQEIYKNKNKPL